MKEIVLGSIIKRQSMGISIRKVRKEYNDKTEIQKEKIHERNRQ